MDIMGRAPREEEILDDGGLTLKATHVSRERIAVRAQPGYPRVALNWSRQNEVLVAQPLTPAAARHLAARLLAAADIADSVAAQSGQGVS